MINLAGRDILHGWGKFVFTGMGLGLLIGVTLTMAGVYRGMVDDAEVMIDNAGADLWVVQQDTLGPYAEPSSVRDDVARDLLGHARDYGGGQCDLPDDAGDHAGQRQQQEVRVMLVGFEPGKPGEPGLSGCRAAASRARITRRWPTSRPALRWAKKCASAATTTPWSG